MDQETWERWRRDWEWVLAAMAQKEAAAEAEPDELEIDPPISVEALERIISEHRLLLPTEFKDVLTRFSAKVRFNWWIMDSPIEFYGISSGPDDLWNVSTLATFKEQHDGIMRRHCPDPSSDDPWCRVWRNKTPFILRSNGDYVTFDMSQGDQNCPVVYLDHEGGDLNGCRLGVNFVDFITRWSNLGCPSAFGDFWDPDHNLLADSGTLVESWKRWLDE